jgi:peroxiredoxin
MPVESSMLPLGTSLPDFTLPDLDGNLVSLTQFAAGRPLLVMVVCNHCPYVKHLEDEIGRVTAQALAQGVATVAICSNDVTTHPSDDVDGLREQVSRANWAFPYLVDESQDLSRALQAVCTPDFFLFDKEGKLAYRGAFDEASPGNDNPVTGHKLRAAIAAVAHGETVPEPHSPALGCSIKWKAA